MNPTKTLRVLFALAAGSFAAVATAAAAEYRAADRVREFLSAGKLSLDVRPRYETVDHTNDETAHALTVRTRLGYTTAERRGFTGMIEAENIASPFPNSYNQSQMNPGGADRAVVMDPTGTEINQAWIGYHVGRVVLKAGRQQLAFDNGRFVGDVAWRQNMQTFDAALVEYNAFEKLALSYAHIYRVNRVLGEDHPQGVYDSNSHALHATYSGLPGGTLAAYAYLFEFKGAVVGNSCATYGVSYAGAQAIGRFNVAYRAEYALQTDYGNSPLTYSANYLAAQVDVSYKRVSAGLGYELQGTDNNFGFRTPLGSLHAFNGWADVFLLTPTQGLRDSYASVSARLPWWEIGLTGTYHRFATDSGLHLGNEVDLQATYRISESLTALVKYASFRREATMVPDVRKFWLQMELKY